MKAENFTTFAGAYHVINGAFEGFNPDTAQNYVCERCGTGLMHVYVFTDGLTFAHVGIDCAKKMGVPADQLKLARTFFELELAARTAATAAQRQADFVTANRLEFAADLADLVELLKNDCLNDFEKNAIAQQIACVEHNVRNSKNYVAKIKIRIALVRTSAALVAGKIASLTLRAWRDSVVLYGNYGASAINFLTDGVNSYIYKGAAITLREGDTVTAGWTVTESELRDGLTSSRINRPTKMQVVKLPRAPERW